MAKIYGGRWRLVDKPPLGKGGQADVFRAVDESGRVPGKSALKRVRNPKRHDRFVREIAAIKRLTDPVTNLSHPNVVSLIDHSALDEIENPEKQFLVMPIAEGGDLSDPNRLSLYTDSLDGVLTVARQIAAALQTAHAAEVVHRDVKPQNVLFTGHGHDLWLSDFGICLIRELPRLTESPEVVGPWAFMAPELAMGGELEVPPSVDIYSLGKVIFYMLSGGAVIPREELHIPRFQQVFNKGERYGLMELLLRRMICDQAQRIQNINEVIGQLEKIAAWEHNAKLIPISEDALSAIEKLQRKSIEAGRVATANKDAREQEKQIRSKIQASVTDWLTAGLSKIVPTITTATIKCEVRTAAIPGSNLRVQTGHTSMLVAMNGIELSFIDVNDSFGRQHALQFFVCEYHKQVVTVTSGPQPALKEHPAKDLEYAVLPYYRQTLSHRASNAPSDMGYIARKTMVGQNRGNLVVPPSRGRRATPEISYHTVEIIERSFEREVALNVIFPASQWPANEGQMRDMLKEALGQFIAHITSDPRFR